MSLINDALKEAKAQSSSSGVPPDLAERMNEGQQGQEADQDANGSAENQQKELPAGHRKRGGLGDIAIFLVLFLLLLGGALAAGFFLFPELARKAGPDSANEAAKQQASTPAQTRTAANSADDPGEPADGRGGDSSAADAPDTRHAEDSENTAVASAETATDPEPALQSPDEPADGSPAPASSAPVAQEDPEPVETAAKQAEAVKKTILPSQKPQPAPAAMRKQFHLSAIVGSASRRMAVINGGIVQTGDTVNGITIVSISRQQLLVEKDGAQYILRPSSTK